MDADHFDALTRALVSRRSRRRLVAAAGAFLGGLLARAPSNGAYDALAGKGGGKDKKKKKKKKDEKEQPCDPLLIPLHCGPCHLPICLSGHWACVQPTQGSTPCGGDCCPPGQQCCGGSCIDQSWCCVNGAAKVPDCGQTCCPPGDKCCEGICIAAIDCCTNNVAGCPTGKTCCSGTCIDNQTQCCANALHVGVPCDGNCCITSAPYNSSCCTNEAGAKVCWARLSPCSDCQYQCGTTCCPTDQKCCFAFSDGSKPDRCIPAGGNCFA